MVGALGLKISDGLKITFGAELRISWWPTPLPLEVRSIAVRDSKSWSAVTVIGLKRISSEPGTLRCNR